MTILGAMGPERFETSVRGANGVAVAREVKLAAARSRLKRLKERMVDGFDSGDPTGKK